MPWPSILITLTCCCALWLAAGDSLGLWLGGFAIVAILVPFMSLRRARFVHRLFDGGAVVDCVILMWLIAALVSEVTVGQWLMCSISLIAFATAGFGVAMLLASIRLPALLCATVMTLALLLWLAAPVWLSAQLNDSTAGRLSDVHPLLAINGQVKSLGIWLEQPAVYRHTALGQDIAYALPTTVWWSAGMHGLIGVVAAGLALIGRGECPPSNTLEGE